MKDSRSANNHWNFVRWFPILVAVATAALIGCITHQSLIDVIPPDDVFLRLGCGLIVLALALGSAKWVSTIDAIERQTNWWDVGWSPDTPTWEDVLHMTIGSSGFDPVIYRPKYRRTYIYLTIKAVIGYLTIICFAIEMISIALKGSILKLMFTNHPDSWPGFLHLKLDGNLTAILALLAAVVSIYFTHRQLQAKVKADSRQAWIDKLRTNIAHFAALVDQVHYLKNRRDLDKVRIKLTKCRLEMELMLNPSEKDHRLLMYLSLKLAFFDGGMVDLGSVHDVEYLFCAIKGRCCYDALKWAPLLDPIPDRFSERAEHEKVYSDLIGYTMRLAHVVLKREWQRVKATR